MTQKDSRSTRKATKIPRVWKAAGMSSSSLHRSLCFELFFITGLWAGSLLCSGGGFTLSVFGKWSRFSGKGINYSQQARLLTLCPRTELERREKDSCALCPHRSATSVRAQLSQVWSGVGSATGLPTVPLSVRRAYLGFSYPTRILLQATNYPILRICLIYKHFPRTVLFKLLNTLHLF